jgi:hypothetical protein
MALASMHYPTESNLARFAPLFPVLLSLAVTRGAYPMTTEDSRKRSRAVARIAPLSIAY